MVRSFPVRLATLGRRVRHLPLPLVCAVLAALLTLGLALELTASAGGDGSGTRIAAHARPSMLPQAVTPSPVVVIAPDGHQVTCPSGARPAIMLTGGVFTPPLAEGRLLGKGRYQIRLHGTVDNETSEPVVIHGISVTVRGERWSPQVIVAATLPAQSSVDVVIEGAYRSDRADVPDIHTHLDWDWQTASLANCGVRGLIDDD